MLFMHLYIGAKLQAAMFEIVNALASDDGMGTVRDSEMPLQVGKLFSQKTLAYTILTISQVGMC